MIAICVVDRSLSNLLGYLFLQNRSPQHFWCILPVGLSNVGFSCCCIIAFKFFGVTFGISASKNK